MKEVFGATARMSDEFNIPIEDALRQKVKALMVVQLDILMQMQKNGS